MIMADGSKVKTNCTCYTTPDSQKVIDWGKFQCIAGGGPEEKCDPKQQGGKKDGHKEDRP